MAKNSNAGKVSPQGIGGMSIPRGPNGQTGSVPKNVPMKGATIGKGASKGGWTTTQKFK